MSGPYLFIVESSYRATILMDNEITERDYENLDLGFLTILACDIIDGTKKFYRLIPVDHTWIEVDSIE